MAVPDNGLFGATAGKKSLPTIEVAPARREGEACPAQLERSESVDGPERSAASASSKVAQQNVLRSLGEEGCPNALGLSALFQVGRIVGRSLRPRERDAGKIEGEGADL